LTYLSGKCYSGKITQMGQADVKCFKSENIPKQKTGTSLS
jgi:hypothetical protein